MMDKLRELALKQGANNATIIDPSTIQPRVWVRMKCQFGCPAYGTNYTCPPHVPPLKDVKEFLSEYTCGLLIEFVGLATLHDQKRVLKVLLRLEKEAFFEGYYKAFGIAAGPCHLCKVCKAKDGKPCYDMGRRPSLESLGIDVYELVNSSGYTLSPVHKKNDEYKSYGVLLLY